MKDHIWEHNNRYRLVKVDGQQDQFDLIPVPGTVYQVGTPINKTTLLQDTTYTKYKNASKFSMPTAENGTPNDVLNSLLNSYANSISIMMGESQAVGGGNDELELEGFAKWNPIVYDATGKCTLDTSGYCTKLYIPKGIKKVHIMTSLRHGRDNTSAGVIAKIYKNGVEIQSLPIVPTSGDSKFYSFVYNTVINTTGNGSEYIQLYLKGEKQTGVFAKISQIQCSWLISQMLTF